MLLPTIQLVLSSLSSHEISLTVREALSGIFGSISLASWIFLLLPQLIENYRNQSAEAVSLPFILIWFVGDICNLLGGLWADLVPVVIAIGGYFCISDGVLIGQTLYYGIRNRRREGKSFLQAATGTMRGEDTPPKSGANAAQYAENAVAYEESGEISPLLRKRSRTASITIPGSTSTTPLLSRRRSSELSSHRPRRRSSAAAFGSVHSTADGNLSKILEESDSQSGARLWLKNLISIFAICAIATAGWALAYESGAWTPTPLPKDLEGGDSEPAAPTAKGAQILGYASAVLYLCARIPQILKNYRDQSCEGLSLLFFILSLIGNLTYGAGILAHSTQRDYVVKNVPWLIGSLGTMAEDIVIFVQFHLYRNSGNEIALNDEDETIGPQNLSQRRRDSAAVNTAIATVPSFGT